MHTHIRAHAHKYTYAGHMECANFNTHSDIQYKESIWIHTHTCTHARTQRLFQLALPGNMMTQWWPHNISPLFHTPLVFFSALLPGRSHNPPALQRGKKKGDEREEEEEGGWEGRDEKLQGEGMIGQPVCMCYSAEIAQGKQELAWELNHLSTVPLSESPITNLVFSGNPFILLPLVLFC